ncbi:MAG: asparaginase, partial [Neisseriaceae bacterium]|nr:asparaginase [Neisseriaceae bacterium]
MKWRCEDYFRQPESIMMKITLFYTGGTIGMIDTPNGFTPDLGLLQKMQQHFSGSLKGVELLFKKAKQVIDSSQISLQHWAEWVEEIRQILPHTDAVIVLHGTDTMAYTAALFRLMFADSHKPIIFTG